jgi:hypothetical protein
MRRRSEAGRSLAGVVQTWPAEPAVGRRRAACRCASRAALVLVCASAAAAVLPAGALATLWVSSSGTDTGYCSQANPCATLSRAVSLAIPNDTIYVGPGIIFDHVNIDSSITGLTIQGAGVRATTISGGVNKPGTVITVQPSTTVTINDLTITGGNGARGGGVDNQGDLTMRRDEVGFNTATAVPGITTGSGGGVFSASDNGVGNLTMTDSTVIGNRASDGGGGIFMVGGTLERDVINNNRVIGGGQPVAGGVYAAQARILDNTIFGNEVTDSTGHAVGYAGGVYAYLTDLISNTVARNTAATAGGVAGEPGALSGNLLSGNSGGNCSASAPPRSSGYNLSDDNTCGFLGTGDINDANPQLEDLADNGGPTETMAIPASSSAYDANPRCAGTDARGVPFLQRGATRCDMGAYQVQAPSTYVANPAAGSVTAYAADVSGNVAPVLSLAGPATGLSQPTGVVVDGAGRVFVSNPAANSITEYAPEVTGNVSAVATIAGSRTRLNEPQDVALDGNGNLWVANGAGSVTEYAAGAGGNVAPMARIAGSLTKLGRPRGLVFDPSGNLRVTNANGTVNTYSATANGNVPPLSRLVGGKANGLSTNLQGLNFDGSGNLVVADAGASRVVTFAGNASRAATPLNLLTGGLTRPTGLDVDVSGNVFVTDNAANAIAEFAQGSAGAVSPAERIAGSLTGLVGPAFLSELPPPPVPRVRVSTRRHESRRRLLGRGIILRVRASGRLAFRAQPITVSAAARVRQRSWATARALPLRPGTLTLRLVTTKSAAHLLRRRHHTRITVTVTIRGGFGSQRRRLTVTCFG